MENNLGMVSQRLGRGGRWQRIIGIGIGRRSNGTSASRPKDVRPLCGGGRRPPLCSSCLHNVSLLWLMLPLDLWPIGEPVLVYVRGSVCLCCELSWSMSACPQAQQGCRRCRRPGRMAPHPGPNSDGQPPTMVPIVLQRNPIPAPSHR